MRNCSPNLSEHEVVRIAAIGAGKLQDMINKLLQLAETSPVAWDPVKGGRRAWVCFDDDRTYDLGPDPEGSGFDRIATKMLSGDYYPPDAVVFSGKFRTEDRVLRVGDRILQCARMLGKLGGPKLYSSAEIFVAEREAGRCKIGYVTTQFHFGRGIWSADLTLKDRQLSIRVTSTASPNHWLFWIGLPVARFLQLRARRRAIEEFRLMLRG